MAKITQEVFIQRIIALFGDKYDLSNIKYTNKDTKIKLLCPEHGNFEVVSANILDGSSCGCRECRKLNTNLDNFKEQSIKIHDNFYDYSETTEILPKYKVKIICPIHGRFEQNLYSHMKGAKCPKCQGSEKWDATTFLKRAKQTHGDRYNYSEVVYVDRFTQVDIICQQHGLFKQRPVDHCKGSGCHSCWKDKRQEANNKRRKTTEQFIKEAKEVHGDLYDYSKVSYENLHKSVTITCTEHGDFQQEPCRHLAGCGCTCCFRIRSAKDRSLKIEDVIPILINKYPDLEFKYDTFKGLYKDIDFVCKEHGLVSRKFDSLWYNDTGCPKCRVKYSFSYEEPAVLYVNKIIFKSGKVTLKFGISGDYNGRIFLFKQRNTECKEVIKESVVSFKKGKDAFELERLIKQEFRLLLRDVTKEELPDGYTETLNISHKETLLNFINTYTGEQNG